MNRTAIEYVDLTWNPCTGCEHGCDYCYARRIANRFNGTKAWLNGFAPVFHPERLSEPIKHKKPSRILVGSMGDLFGGWVPDQWIVDVMSVVETCPQHTFLFLTKNPARYSQFAAPCADWPDGYTWPDNAWLGTSIENQEAANKRVPRLMEACALIRWLSIEPILGDIDLTEAMYGKEPYGMNCFGFTDGVGEEAFIQWVAVGAQTGPGAKPPKPESVNGIIEQCKMGVPLFLKNNLNWPERIQEYPKVGEWA